MIIFPVKKSFLICCLAISLVASASAQTLSLTFDDGLNPDEVPLAEKWNAEILETLKRNNISAIVFPSVKYVGGTNGVRLIEQWSKFGHAVGNHTYSHRSLSSSKVSLAEFEADVLRGAVPFESMPTWVRMLRFPYLKEGNTEGKRDGIRAWMNEQNYRPAYVSIDTSDWFYNDRLEAKVDPSKEDLTRFEKAYVFHLIDRAKYYDDLAFQLTGRRPAHVMLLHVSRINATYLQNVIDGFKSAGWRLVPALEAYADPLYSTTSKALPAGESIIWSLAKERGVAGLRYPAEDDVYEKPTLSALGF